MSLYSDSIPRAKKIAEIEDPEERQKEVDKVKFAPWLMNRGGLGENPEIQIIRPEDNVIDFFATGQGPDHPVTKARERLKDPEWRLRFNQEYIAKKSGFASREEWLAEMDKRKAAGEEIGPLGPISKGDPEGDRQIVLNSKGWRHPEVTVASDVPVKELTIGDLTPEMQGYVPPPEPPKPEPPAPPPISPKKAEMLRKKAEMEAKLKALEAEMEDDDE